MDDADMQQALIDAMTPYFLAFLRRPQEARVDVIVSTDGADAVLFVAITDSNELQGDSALRGHLSRSYNELCRRLDDTRLPTLIFQSTSGSRTRGHKRAKLHKPNKRRKTRKPGKARKSRKGPIKIKSKGRKPNPRARARKK